MKTLPSLFIGLLFVLPSLVSAETYKPYEWEKDRKRSKLSEAEEKLSELIIKNHIEFVYSFEGEELYMFNVLHKIVVVNNNEAVQRNNRIMIPMYNTLALADVRARVITKEGKVIVFDKNNLKEIKDEESGAAYKIFAVEGIEIGSEIEYFFVRKMSYALHNKAFLQMEVPIQNSSFLLSCPRHLKFDLRSYPTSAAVKSDTTHEANVYALSLTDVPALLEEPLSYFEANRKRIEFKLAYNTARSTARMYTWNDAAKHFYTVINAQDKDDVRALEQFCKKLKDNPSAPLPNRIRNLERQVKAMVQLNEESSEKSLSKISTIVKTMVASKEGMTRLFNGVFNSFHIAINIVLTCNRESARFDPTFDTWGFLDDYFLYFPDTKGFLAPYDKDLHYPLIPYEFTSQKALFIEPLSLGGVNSGLASIDEIPAIDYSLNKHDMLVDVAFDEKLTLNIVNLRHHYGGYSARYYAPYFETATDEQKTVMFEDMLDSTAPDKIIKSSSAKVITDSISDEFVTDIIFQSSHFIEKAGPKLLFKVGLLIGPQIEMYNENNRVAEIENDYNRTYNRVINVKLPAGYTLKNAKDLLFDVTYKEGDAEPFLFKTAYAIKGDMLTLKIYEYYKQIYAPVSRYEDYRKVINASADFNKVTLVFEKDK
jgi:hypothetical protein